MDKLKFNIDQSSEVFKRSTRSQNNAILKVEKNAPAASKRKADASPKAKEPSKRLAFVDLTNNGAEKVKLAGKKTVVKVEPKQKLTNENRTRTVADLSVVPKPRGPIKKTRSTVTEVAESTGNVAAKSSKVSIKTKNPSLSKVKIEKKEPTVTTVVCKNEVADDSYPDDRSRVPSSGSSSTDSTLYVTASEVLSPPDVIRSVKKERKSLIPVLAPAPLLPRVPANVNDFDREHLKDPSQVAIYALDIFNYLRERESNFKIKNYMEDQFCLTKQMRALLVDWMVEVQETFELNHETLYLSVKIVDLYLSKVMVAKETLQLVGAAAVFIASKYDERSPPLIEDFLYICDGAYTRREMIRAELNVFKTIGYDLGIPLSYRFLRRFARCAKILMPVLTLARFILETSLMDYQFVTYSDSKLACACLLLALNMTHLSGWTATLQYYTSYKFEDFESIVYKMNDMLHQPHKDSINTIRNKYMHTIFFEVAKTPLLKNSEIWH